MTTPTPTTTPKSQAPQGWTIDPSRTQTSQDGRRRRVWACRDESIGQAPSVSVSVPQAQVQPQPHRPRAWDVDPSDDDGGYVALGEEAMRASAEAGVRTRNAIRRSPTWQAWAPWIGCLLFFGVALYGYGEPRGWFGVSVGASTNSAAGPSTNRQRGGVADSGTGSGGTNHCRALLEKWRRSDQRFNWTDDDAGDVDTAIRADGGRP